MKKEKVPVASLGVHAGQNREPAFPCQDMKRIEDNHQITSYSITPTLIDIVFSHINPAPSWQGPYFSKINKFARVVIADQHDPVQSRRRALVNGRCYGTL